MTRSYRIVHLLASNFFGGPEKQLVEHACRIAGRNMETRIVSFLTAGEGRQLLERAAERGVPTTALHASSAFDPRQIGALVRLLRNERVDLLCAHGYKANVIGRIASWCTGTPFTVISRGWTGEDRKIRCYEWLDRAFLRVADHIVAVSAGQLKKITRLGIPETKVSVIHNCIAVEDGKPPRRSLRSELGLAEETLLVASAGRLSPEKNYAGLIRAAQIVCRRRPEVRFAVFGEGVLRGELEQKIEQAGLSGRFLLPGFRTGMQELLREIDIFALPSFTEGLPNVILEAFAAGKPVVATAVGGTPEIVEEGVSGFLTDPLDTEAMAERLLRLAGDPRLRERMGASGLQRVRRSFTFEGQTDQYEQLYLGLING